MNDVENNPLPPQLPLARLEECKSQVCGACLLELVSRDDATDKVGGRPRRSCTLPRLGLIDACSHSFHAKCIDVWAKVENSCPQCRIHFTRLAVYDLTTGECQSCREVEERDQVDWDALGAASSDEDTGAACEKCGGRSDAALLLICDGKHGSCSRSCHTYCDGFGRTVPPGNWFCQQCRFSPAESGREASESPREVASRPAAKRRRSTNNSASSSSGVATGSASTTAATPFVGPSNSLEVTAALNGQCRTPQVNGSVISSSVSRRGRGRGRGTASSRASALLATQLRDMPMSKSAPQTHDGIGNATGNGTGAASCSAGGLGNRRGSGSASASGGGSGFLNQISSTANVSKSDIMEGESHAKPIQQQPKILSENLQSEPASKVSASEYKGNLAAASNVKHARKAFGRLRASFAVTHAIDLDENDDGTNGRAISSEMRISTGPLSSALSGEQKAHSSADTATGCPLTNPSAGYPPKKWFLLALPPLFEVWTERFRRFASTYLVCERGLPHVVRKAERLWNLSVGGFVREPSGHGIEDDSEGWEVSARRLMHFARDTFKLHWASAMDPADDDPCSLRCLRTARERVLCVLYCGSAGRMKPSDVVRGELQFRRRLLQHLNDGHAPEQPLPPCALPSTDERDEGGGALPAARASAAMKTSTAAASAAAAAVGAAAVQFEMRPKLLEALEKEPWYDGQIVHVAHRQPRAAKCATLRAALDTRLVTALGKLVSGERPSDISRLQLYSHQADAVDAAVSQGQDVVLSTSTGSGKSLVYLAAVFDALLHDSDATAIFIFPTKALAQDQLRALGRLVNALSTCGVPPEQLKCACLDGDTPFKDRTQVRRDARVVLTNPDMLHSHLLPKHVEYDRLLGNLRYLVLDEMHVYRGAFGAHVSCIMRRLRRLLDIRGSRSLQFVACSATVSNPGEHFQRLVGPRALPAKVITIDGSPSGGGAYVLWNPGPRASKAWVTPSTDPSCASGTPSASESAHDSSARPEFGTSGSEKTAREDLHHDASRRSPIVEVARLIAWLVSRDVSVLAFCKWRSLVEIILQDVQEALVASGAKEMARRVISYRAGYPAAMRRELERRIFSRDALGVVCTNALELGVDIGRLDCTISLGFPGSIASLRQQFGRAGRAGRAGVSFFVGFDDPTDQHIMRQPTEFFARGPEAVALAPLNPAVLHGHLPCAAVEQALTLEDAQLWLHSTGAEPSLLGPGSGKTSAESSVDQPVDGSTRSETTDASTSSEEPAAIWATVLQKCKAEGLLEEYNDGERQLLRGVGAPHRGVSIRAVDDRYEVVVEEAGTRRLFDEDVGGFVRLGADAAHSVVSSTVIDEIDASKAFYSIHPGAVYRCRGEEYRIVDLNLRRRRAIACKCEAPLAYYTRAFDSTIFRILTRERHASRGGANIAMGRVERESRVKSFKKYWKARDAPHENEVELDLPPWTLRTRGLWFEYPVDSAISFAPSSSVTEPCPESSVSDHEREGCHWAGAHAAMHALLHILPLFVLADRADVEAACVDEYGAPPMERPRLLLFDAQEGGTGLCDAAFPYALSMLREARRLVEECPCEDGCPSCIVNAQCREYNRLLSKRGALAWLRGLEGTYSTEVGKGLKQG